jgi:hypothetical protein
MTFLILKKFKHSYRSRQNSLTNLHIPIHCQPIANSVLSTISHIIWFWNESQTSYFSSGNTLICTSKIQGFLKNSYYHS